MIMYMFNLQEQRNYNYGSNNVYNIIWEFQSYKSLHDHLVYHNNTQFVA